MAKAKNEGKQMPISGSYSYGNATGQPKSTGKIIHGEDLRGGKGKQDALNGVLFLCLGTPERRCNSLASVNVEVIRCLTF